MEYRQDHQMRPRSLSNSCPESALEVRKKISKDVRSASERTFLDVMHTFQILLPSFSQLPKQFSDYLKHILLDKNILEDLIRAKVINFSDKLVDLYPITTKADGNCLMHAVSLFLWGIHDGTPVFLRSLVYSALSKNHKDEYRRRWKYRLQNQLQLEEDASLYSVGEWSSIVKAANPVKPEGQPYHFLEDIHVFAACQILRRPIIILGEPVVRSLKGDSISTNTLYGIYLPITWDNKRCCKSPIVLAYSNCHFVPLLPCEEVTVERHGHCAAPLVLGNNMERLPIRLLLEQEEAKASKLLLEYLDIIDIKYGKGDSLNTFQAAIITPQTYKELNIMEQFCNQVEKGFNEEEERRTCGNEEIVSQPDTERRPKSNLEPHSVSELIQLPVIPVNNHHNYIKCVSPKCDFYGTKNQMDMCSECYKKHLETSKSLRRQRQAMGTPGCRHSAPLLQMSRSSDQEEEAERLITGLSIVGSSCKVRDCPNFASVNTHPYCHEHVRLRSPGVGPAATGAPLMATGASSSSGATDRRACITPGCDRVGEARYHGRCGACHTARDLREVSLEDHSILRHIRRSSAPQREVRTTQHPNQVEQAICTKPGCNRSSTERGLCMQCDRQNNRLTEVRPHVLHAAYPSPHTLEYQQQNYQVKCVFAQCDRDGCEVFNGLCERCYQRLCTTNISVPLREPQNEPSSETTKRPCTNVTCNRYGEVVFNGLCQQCFSEKRPCLTPSCRMYGLSTLDNYCLQCFQDRELMRQGATEPESIRFPPAARECKQAGCTLYGDPNFDGYCTEHFRARPGYRDLSGLDLAYSATSSLRSLLNSSTEGYHSTLSGGLYTLSPVAVPSWGFTDRQEQTVWQSGRVNRPLSNLDLRVTPQDPTHSIDESFQQAVAQIETNSRTAVSSCKTPHCSNYGNSRCQGYCNSCFPKISASR